VRTWVSFAPLSHLSRFVARLVESPRAASRRAKLSLAPGCDIPGCASSSRRCTVGRDGLTLSVCRRCMQELTSLYGWRLVQLGGFSISPPLLATDVT
jgi:hypothetical protein